MGSYRRAKKEESVKPSKYELSFSVGSVEDSFESLKAMCNDKANEITKDMKLEYGEKMQVVFWTEDFPELIGVADFIKNENGDIIYSFDYSYNTLRKI